MANCGLNADSEGMGNSLIAFSRGWAQNPYSLMLLKIIKLNLVVDPLSLTHMHQKSRISNRAFYHGNQAAT